MADFIKNLFNKGNPPSSEGDNKSPTASTATSPNENQANPTSSAANPQNAPKAFKDPIYKPPTPTQPSYTSHGYTSHDNSRFQEPPYYGTRSYAPIYVHKPSYAKRPVAIIVVEASPETNAYCENITKIVNKIISDNPDAYFKLIRIGNASTSYVLCDHDKLKSVDISRTILSLKDAPYKFDLSWALKLIDSFVKEYITGQKVIDQKNVINDARVIFIGTGRSDTTDVSVFLKPLCASVEIKSVKYFCMKDEDAIMAAAHGFPVIGHIDANFYSKGE